MADALRITPPIRSIILMICAVASFTVLDSIAKYLSRDLPIFEIVWARYLFSLLIFPLVFPSASIREAFRTTRPWIQIARAMLLVVSTASIFFAVHFLPLAETYAISFVSPLLTALFAVFLLGEKVSTRRWVAIVLGFAGAVIVIQPGSGIFDWAVVFPLTMAVCWALYQVITRLISATEPPLTTLFFTMMVGTVVMSLVVPFYWVMPDLKALMLMVLMGLVGLFGQLLLIKAFASSDSSLLAPFGYSQIIWATLIGIFIFGDYPQTSTFIGVTIIIVSGFIVTNTSQEADRTGKAKI